jgi:hypothetical protein
MEKLARNREKTGSQFYAIDENILIWIRWIGDKYIWRVKHKKYSKQDKCIYDLKEKERERERERERETTNTGKELKGDE